VWSRSSLVGDTEIQIGLKFAPDRCRRILSRGWRRWSQNHHTPKTLPTVFLHSANMCQRLPRGSLMAGLRRGVTKFHQPL
jgi:hypothetical protein